MTHPLLAALLVNNAPDLFSGEVRAHLREDALDLVLGAILAASGILSLIVHGLRKKSDERGLFWFGVFTAAYGFRLIFSTEVFRFTATADPAQRPLWRYLQWACTYSLIPLGYLFLTEVFPQWAKILSRRVVRLLAAFAGAAVLSDLISHRPGSLHLLNNAIVVVGFVVVLRAMPRRAAGHFSLSLRVAGLAYMATVLVENVWSFYAASFSDLFQITEALSFTCFLAVLGAVVVSRIFEREEQLIEVHKELEIARRIQTAILPRTLPSSPSITMAARYLAMTAVAGDFYDFLLPGENRIGILIADVSGHGVPAALIASMVKVAISAQLHCADDPAQVLSGMNRVLCGKMQGQFVSAAYLYLDTENWRLRYAAAGHPPLLRCEGDAIESITENGMPLGLFAHAPYAATERKLTPGSRFLLYTDGLMEAADATDEFFGEDRIRDVLRQAQALTAEQTATMCVERVTAWSGVSQQDDLTLLVVDVT